jgi:hypothetical protein
LRGLERGRGLGLERARTRTRTRTRTRAPARCAGALRGLERGLERRRVARARARALLLRNGGAEGGIDPAKRGRHACLLPTDSVAGRSSPRVDGVWSRSRPAGRAGGAVAPPASRGRARTCRRGPRGAAATDDAVARAPSSGLFDQLSWAGAAGCGRARRASGAIRCDAARRHPPRCGGTSHPPGEGSPAAVRSEEDEEEDDEQDEAEASARVVPPAPRMRPCRSAADRHDEKNDNQDGEHGVVRSKA